MSGCTAEFLFHSITDSLLSLLSVDVNIIDSGSVNLISYTNKPKIQQCSSVKTLETILDKKANVS